MPAAPTSPPRPSRSPIARRVLAGQGPRAWPVCGRRAGLTKSNGKADRYATPATNPGATATTGAVPVVKKKAVAVQPAVVTAPSGKTIKVKRGDTLRKMPRATMLLVAGKAC